MFTKARIVRASVLSMGFASAIAVVLVAGIAAIAQAPVAIGREIGTVKTIAGSSIVLATDAGQQVTVNIQDGARILQLPPGSTSLKDAQTITLTDISVGDRILATGRAGDSADVFTALRVILMKSSDIAQKREGEQEDWRKHGTGGIVSAVDESAGVLTVAVGAKKLLVKISSGTQFRRYAGDSVKFEDATSSSFGQIQVGDQVRVRGLKSDDGTSVQAEEVVSGSFKNLSGVIASIDTTDGTLKLKDLVTKRLMMVKITTNSNVHMLPPQAAKMFAARARGAAGERPGAVPPEGAAGTGESAMKSGAGRSAGADLSQLVSRLPEETIADLKVGDAVMIVASQAEPASAKVTAVTLLSGVEPILAAAPSGSSEMALSPWSVGGDAPDASAQ
jgi:transcription antitermination factor NusG